MSDPTSPANADPIALSALLASRLCHDLVNPVGALSSGLEVLGDPGMADPDMRDAALDLIRDSAAKSVALLKFARIAYGAAGAYDGDVPLDEAREAVGALYATHKADLVWSVSAVAAPKEVVKILLTFIHAAADFVPRGGEVKVSDENAVYRIDVTGERLFVADSFTQSLTTAPESLTPKQSPVFIAALMARAVGATIAFDRAEKWAHITLDFSGMKAATPPAALTKG